MPPDKNPSPWVTIYALTESSGEIRYVGRTGKSILHRLSRHSERARQNGGTCQKPVSTWLRSRNFEVKTIELDRVPRDGASRSELEWIKKLAQTCDLLNSMGKDWSPSEDHRNAVRNWNHKRFSDPAARERVGRISKERVFTQEERAAQSERARGRKHTAEARAKMSAAHKGVPKSPEARENIAAANRKRGELMRGVPLSEETRRKISEAGKGRPKSEEWKQKMRDSHARRRAEREVMGG